MSAMKIGHCIHGLGLGGAQRIIEFIVRESDRERFSHFVYSPLDGVFRERVERAGATVRIVPRYVPKFDPSWVVRLARAMRGDGIDIVHAHLFGDSLHGYLASRLAGRVPMIMTIHNGIQRHSRLQLGGYLWLVKRTTWNVACSESVRDSFTDAYDDLAGLIEAIPNGIQIPTIPEVDAAGVARLKARLGLTQETIMLAGVGRLVEQKGFGYMVSAFAELVRITDVPVKLVIFGDGPLLPALKEQAVREGVAGGVVFAGFRDDVFEMLAAVDVYLSSSLFEGLPVAVLEAMLMERCIVATDVPGNRDAIRHGEQGILVPERDPKALAEAVRDALADPAARHRYAAAAKRRFFEEFTAERMTARYEEIYTQIHQQGRRLPKAVPAVGRGHSRCSA